MGLKYDTTVPRQLVRRHSVNEVFLTDYRLGVDHQHEVAVGLPVAHRMFRPVRDTHDALAVAEAFRQAVILLCQAKYRVPLQHKYLMERFGFDILDDVVVRPSPTPLVFDMSVVATRHHDGVMSWMNATGVLREQNSVLARCNAGVNLVTSTDYRAIRNGLDNHVAHFRNKPAGTSVLPADSVGRTDPQDVVLALHDSSDELFCAPDPRNHALFDHPVDHVPGMVILEAARQALRYRIGSPAAQFATLSAAIRAIVEWEAPCTVSVIPATDDSTGRYWVRFTQSDGVAVQVEAVMAPLR